MKPLTVLLDANVLYPAALRDLFMRLALQDLFRAKWSNTIHEEWIRSVQRDYPNITRQQLERTRDLMNHHLIGSLVTGFEHLIDGIKLPDPDDRHVLAAAIIGKASLIVTFNRSDFPKSVLSSYGVAAEHPDFFICNLLDKNPLGVCAAAREHRSNLRNPPKTVQEYLTTLERQGLLTTVKRLQALTMLI